MKMSTGRLTYVQILLLAATFTGCVASVCLMVAEHAPVFCREMGAVFLIATALFAAISVIHFKGILVLQHTINTMSRRIALKDAKIESLIRILRDSPGEDQTQ